jgi:prolipoprotein diacylglyceryltransferase
MRSHVVHWLDGVLPGPLAAALAPTWFTCVGLAGVATLFLMLAIGRRNRMDAGVIASIVLWCYVAAVAAGIVVPLTIDAAQRLATTGRMHVRWAGMTSFWGYLAGGIAVAIVCRMHRVPLARLGDLAAVPLGVALVLARLGCFLAGCDYGKVTSLPWAVRFPSGSPAWHDHVAAGLVPASRAGSLPVHPTQLYEAALGISIMVVALCAARTRWARRADGRVFLLAAALYAVGRIAIESLRGDAGRGIYLGLSSGQIFSVVVLAVIAAGWLLRRPRVATAVTATAIAIALAPRAAHAQPPRASAPAPGPTTTTTTQPMPPTTPAMPRTPPTMTTTSAPDSTAVAPAAAASAGASSAPVGAGSSSSKTFQIGALVGFAAPLNRRPEQVATLGGPSLSLGFAGTNAGIWLDLDSLGNRDASHGTILLSGGMTAPIGNRLHLGARVGLGATLVNFDEPAFRDVAGTTLRFEALVDYRFGDSWALWFRPVSFDMLSAADLGGPIATWQMRIGLGYRATVGRKSQPAHAPPASYPAPYPGQPYPPPPPYTGQPQPGQPYPPPPPYTGQPQPAQPYPAQPSSPTPRSR